MAYEYWTKNGYNMFEMSSLLQKAIRRNLPEYAGFAAYELYQSYGAYLWRRLLVISAEDCNDLITSKIVTLEDADRKANCVKGEKRDLSFVSEAVNGLCAAAKNRDACYYALNFLSPSNRIDKAKIKPIPSNELYLYDDEYVPRWAFDCKTVNDETAGDRIKRLLEANMDLCGTEQIGFFDFEEPEDSTHAPRQVTQYGNDKFEMAAMLKDAILAHDFTHSGYPGFDLYYSFPEYVWKWMLIMSVKYCGNIVTNEIIALKIADEEVNSKRKKEEFKDQVFISKAILLLIRALQSKGVGSLTTSFRLDGREKMIDECVLKDGVIPEWVYDRHTIQGKQAGKTSVDMIDAEEKALVPKQAGFFDNGDWAQWEKNWNRSPVDTRKWREFAKGKIHYE